MSSNAPCVLDPLRLTVASLWSLLCGLPTNRQVELDRAAACAALGDQRSVRRREEELIADVLNELVALVAQADVVAAPCFGVLDRRRTDVARRERHRDRRACQSGPGRVAHLVGRAHFHAHGAAREHPQRESCPLCGVVLLVVVEILAVEAHPGRVLRNESTITSNDLAVESLDHCAWSLSDSVNVGVDSRFASGLVSTSTGLLWVAIGSGAALLALADGAAKIVTFGRLGGVKSLVH